jgi:hypothetical protein
MKIYDIISENTVQEGPVDLLKLAGKGIASGAKWLAQTGARGDLVDMMSKNSQLIRNTLRGTAPTAAEIEKIYGPRAGEIFSKDPNFMAKVLKQYHADRLSTKVPPGTKPPPGTNPPPVPPASTTTSLIRKIPVTGLVAKTISLYGIYDMVQDYNKGVAYFDEQLKNKKITPDVYKAGVDHLKSTLVFQIAASTVVFSVLKHSTGWSTLGYMLRTRSSPMLQTIGNNMGSMSSAARAALIVALDTKEARALWSDMFAGGMMDTIGSQTYNGITELFKKVTNKASEITGVGKPDTSSDTTSASDKDATSTTKPPASTSTNTSPYKSEVPSTSTYKGNPMFKGID